MKKLRTIQVVNVRWFNATAWYGLFLSRLLRESGHETLVLGLEGTPCFQKALDWGLAPIALPLNSTNPLELASLFRALRALTRSFKPDLVNCHRGENFALWGGLKLLDKNFALIRTRGDQRRPRASLANRLLYTKTADALIATNSGIADFLLDHFGAEPERVFTILGGVDTGDFYPDQAAGEAVRAEWGFGAEDFVVGILGRLDPVKGHEVLIRALGLLQEKGRSFKLVCIGASSDLDVQDIKRLCHQVGLGDNCIITGFVPNVRACINALNLGVLSSVASEAIARAALEIIACGVPLLSSDIGVMPDILPAEFLTPLADIEALAAALEECLQNPAKLEALRVAGQKALRELHAADFLEKTLHAYNCALTSV